MYMDVYGTSISSDSSPARCIWSQGGEAWRRRPEERQREVRADQADQGDAETTDGMAQW